MLITLELFITFCILIYLNIIYTGMQNGDKILQSISPADHVQLDRLVRFVRKNYLIWTNQKINQRKL